MAGSGGEVRRMAISLQNGEKTGVIAGIIVVGVVLACVFICVLCRRRGRRMSGQTRKCCKFDLKCLWKLLCCTKCREEVHPSDPLPGMPERFSYNQLSVATGNFSKDSKLGEGGFGSVYRGVLPNGVLVAVKKIIANSAQGEREFTAEVSIISQIRHRNVIQLLGCCRDASRGSYLLVYELMPNGSLDKVLFEPRVKGMSGLSWPQRLDIVRGTAAALDYLHQSWTQQVIHRDIKSSNIMLDERWNVKLGDFGLARLVDHERTATTTMAAGTRGYIAPEIVIFGKFTDKSDVYAFGAVVLEVACGRRALATYLPEEEIVLADWVWKKFGEGDLLSTVDKGLLAYDCHWMEVVLKVGLLCSHPYPAARPTMRRVVEILAGDVLMPSIPVSKPTIDMLERP